MARRRAKTGRLLSTQTRPMCIGLIDIRSSAGLEVSKGSKLRQAVTTEGVAAEEVLRVLPWREGLRDLGLLLADTSPWGRGGAT